MSTLGIDGLISGFSTSDLIDSILDLQARAPVEGIQTRIDSETEKLAAMQTVSANLLGLSITASSLKSTSLFNSKQVQSSNSSLVSASVSSSASLGSFSVEVKNLAKVDQISSDIFSSKTEELGYSGSFIVNGATIDVSDDDTLSTIATQINSANAGVKASVIQLSASQYKLSLAATSTGVDQIELREVGSSGILSSMGLITSDSSDLTYDRTVNANNIGAISSGHDSAWTQSYSGETFTVSDAGGQYDLSVTLDGADMTLSDIADAINTASENAGTNISASIYTDSGGQQYLQITSDTGIPTNFSDPDNVLFGLGVIGGTQSAGFTSKSTAVGSLLGLSSTNSSTITLEDGDGSDSFSFSVDLSSDSLQDIVDQINQQAAANGSDITAQIISADDVYRIELNSASGGVNITGDTANVMQTLGIADRDFKNYDQKGENSQIAYNGLTINRSTNTISDLVDGVTLSLTGESVGTTATISVYQDLSDVESTLQDFVDAYNSMMDVIDEYAYFTSSDDKGVLFGNSTVRDLKNSMANGVSQRVPSMPGASVNDLNDGKGIDLGKIKITDRSGASAEIDLSDAVTVQDIIDTINSASGISVTAKVNSNGTGIEITDSSSGVGAFKIEDVGSSTTAEDLGLDSNLYSNTISGSPIYAGSWQSLTALGITLGTDGTLSFDTSTFETLLSDDPDQVQNLLQATDVGFAATFGDVMDRFTNYSTGLMDTATESIQDKIDSYNDQIDRYNDRATAMETTLRKKFTAMEVALSESQQVSDYLTQYLSGNSS